MSGIRRWFASLLALVLLAGACGSGGDADGGSAQLDPAAAAAADRGDSATTATRAGASDEEVDIFDPAQIRGELVNQYDLELGDCFNRLEALRAGRKVVITSRIECENLHQYEVFSTLSYDAPHPALFPGDDVMVDFGLNACYLEFESFVGEIYELSGFDIGVFIPTRENFENSISRYRGITCWIYRPGLDESDGSARDTGI